MCVFETIFIDFRKMSEKTCSFYRRFRGPKLGAILGDVWSTYPPSTTVIPLRNKSDFEIDTID